jgi:NAD-dependent SIR2 family protein deacetylase
MGEVQWKPNEDLKPVTCTCDCGEIYWTPVVKDGDKYIPEKPCPHCHTCNPMVLRYEKKLL